MKTQRMLHSTFWMHGAAELDLPPLWAMLVGAYDTAGEKEEAKSSSTTSPTSGFLLDFLYPAGTAIFLRQFKWSGPNQSARIGHRLFSSEATRRKLAGPQPPSADDYTTRASEDFAGDGKNVDGTTTEDVPLNGEFPRLLPKTLQLERKMQIEVPQENRDHQRACEEVWSQYTALSADQQLFVAPQVLTYLSSRGAVIDQGRLTTLLDLIPPNKRDETIWLTSIEAYRATGMLALAAELHRSFMEHNQAQKKASPHEMTRVDEISARLIVAQLKAGEWESACETHTVHRMARPLFSMDHSRTGRSIDPIVSAISASLPNADTMALDFATQVQGFLAHNPEKDEDLTRIKHFAGLLASHALTPVLGTLSPEVFTGLLEVVKSWNADSPRRYRDIIEYLQFRGHNKLAMMTFKVFRERFPDQVGLRILSKMMTLACDVFDVETIQLLLDDLFTYHGGPNRDIYRICMVTFARRGNAKTVEALFQQYVKECFPHGKVERAGEFVPLLNVYAKRGELQKVITLFEALQHIHGLTPTVMCWNILIKAYGKVHDIDGAFERFKEMLSSSCKPNHWTIGTLMGICVVRGDNEKTIETYQLGKAMGVPTSVPMIDCLVQSHIQDDNLEEAQNLCEQALNMEFIGLGNHSGDLGDSSSDFSSDPSKDPSSDSSSDSSNTPSSKKAALTGMWNKLLNAHARRLDLSATNTTLQRMRELEIPFNTYTYSALMRCLAATRQADRVWTMLDRVMPQAGVLITSFHYGLAMGAFLAIKNIYMVFKIYEQMLSRNIKPNVQTSLAVLKSNFFLDLQRLSSQDESTEEASFQLAQEYFDQVIRNADPHEMINETPRQGIGRTPVDVAYQTSVYSFMIQIHGAYHMMDRVKQLHEEYAASLPEDRTTREVPMRILEALMGATLNDQNYALVEQCWELALKFAKKAFSQVSVDSQSSIPKILYYHRFSLHGHLKSYIAAMACQDKFEQLHQVLDDIQEMGFVLDSMGWNQYIQWLVKGRRLQLAFEICETRLMDNWAGWNRNRWASGKSKRLPFMLKMIRKRAGYLRPHHYTLITLARGYLDAHAAAAENSTLHAFVEDLAVKYPRVYGAIESMPMTEDDREKQIMTSNEW